MSLYPPSHSVLTMPIPGTKLAPEKFKGEYNYVSRFIQHYERLCDQNNVTLAEEKCETITQYCSKKVGEFIEALDSYSKSDWDQLKKDLLKFYDNDRSSKRYRQKDILAFTEETKLKKIKDLSTWKRYTRGFVRIGGWLKSQGKISEDEHATYFWQGIPRTLRLRIENRLLAQDPTRSLAKPWPVEKVEAAAEAILQRDRFDRNLIDSDEEEQDETDEEDSPDEADSSDEDSDAELKRLKRKAKRLKEMSAMRKAKKKFLTKKYIDSDDEEDSRQRKVAISAKSAPPKANNQQEVEELIKQLNTMSLDDPGYGFAYFKAIKLDRDVEKVVRRPLNGSQNQSRPPGQNNRRDAPPHMAGPQQGGYVPRPPMRCFGCGELGHGISNCQKTNELINAGVLAHDHAGRIVRGDGTYLHRVTVDEPFTVAVERERKAQNPQSNLVTFSEPDKSFYFGDEDSAREDEVDGAWIRDLDSEGETEHFVYPVDAKKRPSAEAARKKANDKVYPEPLPPGVAKGKERMKQPPRTDENYPGPSDPSIPRYGTRRNMQGKELTRVDNPDKVQVPVPVNPKPVIPVKEKATVPEPIPVTVRQQDWDPEDESQMIEDEATVPIRKEKKQIPVQPLQDKTNDRKKPSPRQSAVSAHVDPVAVLTRLLSTPVQLQVGEVLGVSKELSGLLNDSIKLKAGKPLVATSFITRTRGVLIKLHMECDGIPITAIVDTGSQLNIVSKAVWKTAIKRPMDIAKTLAMNDANGGEGILRGLVQHVPLSCGNVVTEANLYVGEHVPFQLLLGRPWQRGNYVSIDERIEGTYLLFKDPKNLEVRYEIMVGIEAPDPSWSFDPAQFAVPANLLITVPETLEATPFQLQASQSRFSDRFPMWKVGCLIWKAVFVLLSILAKIVLYSLWAFVPVAKNLFQGTGTVSETEAGFRALEGLNRGAVEFSSTQNLENFPPPHLFMNNPPTGHIFNACVRENRAPIVPSTYTCSFLDRTDPEILDRVQSELSYHRRTGFNLQAIVGSNSATEIAPVFENGRLARRTILHEATMITNGDNEEDPNIMYGDILMKFFPRAPAAEGPIYFPTWRDSNPVPQTGERLTSQIDTDRGSESQPHALYVDVPDRGSLVRDPSMVHDYVRADSLSRISVSTLASSRSITQSPTIAEASELLNFSSSTRTLADRSPTPFPITVPPASTENTPTPNQSLHPTPVLSPVRVQLSELKTRLEDLRSKGLVRAESCDPPEEIPPVSPSMPPLEPIVMDVEEFPVTCDNRQAKRRKVLAEKLPRPPTRRNLNKEAMKRKRLKRVLELEEGEVSVSDGDNMPLSTPLTVKKPFTSIQELNEAPTPGMESDQESGQPKPCPEGSYWSKENEAKRRDIRNVERRLRRMTYETNIAIQRELRLRQKRIENGEEGLQPLTTEEREFMVMGDSCSEHLSSSEDDETIASTQTTGTHAEISQEDRLFTDDENSPVRVQPPSRRDVVFSANPNMPSLSFHVSVSSEEPSFETRNPFLRMRSPSQTLTEPSYTAAESIFEVPEGKDFFKQFIREKLAPSVPQISVTRERRSSYGARIVIGPKPQEELSSALPTKSSIYSLLNDDSGGSSNDSMPQLIDLADDEVSRGTADMDLESDSQVSVPPELAYPFTVEEIRRGIQSVTHEPTSDLSEDEDRIVDDSDRLPIMEDDPYYIREVEDMTLQDVIEALDEPDLPKNFEEALLAAQMFVLTPSHLMDISRCKSVQGNPTSPHSSNLFQETQAGINYQHNSHVHHGCSPHSHQGCSPHLHPYAHISYLQHLKTLRSRLNDAIEWVGRSLNRDDWRDVFDESLSVLVESGDIFREIQVNRDEFFRGTIPRTNALLTDTEIHFLRSAAGRFRYHGRRDLHDVLVDIISIQTRNPDIIRQLLHAGYLDGGSDESGGLRMLALLEETVVERRD